MGAMTGLADYVAQLSKPTQRFSWMWNTLAANAGKPSTLWKTGPVTPTGSQPSAPAVPDNTTAGGIPHVDGGSGQLWLPRIHITNNSPGTLMIADRLLHAGGLSGTLTGAQAVMGNTGADVGVTITNANPAVISFTAHGFGIGQEVKFTTAGTLPSHIVSGTSYWVSVTGWTANAFSISTTRANALAGTNVSTNGDTNSGTHTCTGQVPVTLTRYTDGKGVRAAYEIGTAVGTTARTVTAIYTDAEANSSKTTPAIPIGATPDREIGTFRNFPLAAQDSSSNSSSGFKALDQITISATTGTAGDIAVVLYKPLLYIPIYGLEDPARYDALFSNGSNLPEIFDAACLMAVVIPNLAGTGVIGMTPIFVET